MVTNWLDRLRSARAAAVRLLGAADARNPAADSPVGGREGRTLEIPARFRDAMVLHATEEDPNECCGLLAGAGGRVLRHYRITNTERSPYRFSMDGRELLLASREIEDGGWEIQVIYHSHTHSPAYPSATDIRLASWPEAYYLIISLMDEHSPDVRMFRIVDGDVTEEPVVITEP